MKAFIIVDMQNDFMPWGNFPVPKGDEIIPIINQLIAKFTLVLAAQDWHPPDHMSFAVNHAGKSPGDVIKVDDIEQILWPVHCVRDTYGSELITDLKKESIAAIFYKGTDRMVDSYSTFYDNARLKSTGLADYLTSRGVQELYIAGVATDYCVLYSALDALEHGFEVHVISDACRAINLNPGDEAKAFQLMQEKGAKIITSAEVLGDSATSRS